MSGIDSKETSHEGQIVSRENVCRFFNRSGGCRNGQSCQFLHVKLTCAYFVSSVGCQYGRRSKYLHQKGGPLSAELNPCPNSGCLELCAGTQCHKCHMGEVGGDNDGPARGVNLKVNSGGDEDVEKREGEHWIEGAPRGEEAIKLCSNPKCSNTTLRDVCGQC